MSRESIADELVNYLVLKERVLDDLPSNLKVLEMEFQTADRIIRDAISQASSVLCLIKSTADKVNSLS